MGIAERCGSSNADKLTSGGGSVYSIPASNNGKRCGVQATLNLCALFEFQSLKTTRTSIFSRRDYKEATAVCRGLALLFVIGIVLGVIIVFAVAYCLYRKFYGGKKESLDQSQSAATPGDKQMVVATPGAPPTSV